MGKFTEQQYRDALAVYASGATRITIDGRTTEYDSRAEFRRFIAEMEADLGLSGAGTTAAKPSVGYATFGRD